MTTQPSDWAVRTAFLELTEAPAYEVLNIYFREEVLIRARELDAIGGAPRAAEAGDKDGERYRWLKAHFEADFCRGTNDYWRITGEQETPREVLIGNGQLTLDYLIDSAMGAVGAGD